jgi:hypothetical protein
MLLSLEWQQQKNSVDLKSWETNQTLKQPNKMKSPYRMMKMKMHRKGDQEEDADGAVGDTVAMIHIGFQAVLLRSIDRQYSTSDAFFKLTGGNPSVPFNIDSDKDASKENI